MKAIEALYEAHKVAFYPFVFETAYSLLELGILEAIYEHRSTGLNQEEIASITGISKYGVSVLVEMAEAAGILQMKDQDKYEVSKIGHFILHDDMVKVNLKFTHDICYKGLFYLKESIQNGKPEGLKELGDWETIYEGLSSLPAKLKKSWFDFDHYYSDNSFDDALKIIFKANPSQIFDIGGNTGKWAIASAQYNSDVKVKIFDLPGQIKVAQENIAKHSEIKDRIQYQPIDLLKKDSEIPEGADVYWMSQFLDCFSEEEIEAILLKIKKNIKPGARIYIMEPFIDNQHYPAATYSLTATSLYFTAIANGNSKMYTTSAMKYILGKAGFECVEEHHLHRDSFHTILELKVKT